MTKKKRGSLSILPQKPQHVLDIIKTSRVSVLRLITQQLIQGFPFFD